MYKFAQKLKQYQAKNIVLDPVMISKSGFDLMQKNAKETLIKELLPLAFVVTPNLPEAEVITGLSIQNLEDMEKAAKIIYNMGAKKYFDKKLKIKLL